MGVLQKVSGLFGREKPINDRESLVDFLDSRAAFLCQKCVIEFCRVRAGVYWQKLFDEADFQQRLDRACWESYAPAMGMVAEMAEAAIRPHAGLRQRSLPDVLSALIAERMARYPVPRGADADFWQRGAAFVAERLQSTQGGAPRPVKEMTKPCARMIFEALPLHEDVVTNDYDYIRNNLRMNLLRAHEDLESRADYPSLTRALLNG